MKLPIYKEPSKKEAFITQSRAKALEYWSLDPKVDQMRIATTQAVMDEVLPPLEKVIDIGAGKVPFKCSVAIDIAASVLDGCTEGILPYLRYPDETFEGVICTDVIAELPTSLHRLALSEIARLLVRDGYFICSTPLDRKSYDAKECFLNLISTEFCILVQKISYAPLFFSRRLGEMILGDGGAEHIIIIGTKAPIR